MADLATDRVVNDDGDHVLDLENAEDRHGGVVLLVLSATNPGDGSRHLALPNLPTTDPHVVDMLWNDAGTLKVSAG